MLVPKSAVLSQLIYIITEVLLYIHLSCSSGMFQNVGVATRWLWCPRVTRLGSPVNAEWLGVTPQRYIKMIMNQFFDSNSYDLVMGIYLCAIPFKLESNYSNKYKPQLGSLDYLHGLDLCIRSLFLLLLCICIDFIKQIYHLIDCWTCQQQHVSVSSKSQLAAPPKWLNIRLVYCSRLYGI